MTRPPRFGAPRADTNPGFRVSRSIFDATHHVGVFVVPVAPRERPWFSFGGLQGRLVGSNRGPLFRCKWFGPSYPERGRCAPSPDLPRPDPGPEEHRETNRWHLQRKREIMGLINRCYRSAKIVSNRLEDGSSLNFLWIGGGIAGPGSILRPRNGDKRIAARSPESRSKARSVARFGRFGPNRSVFP